jgi:diguanylate cyclase (GGDEF)-like protein
MEPKTETFRNYDVSDGLQSHVFNSGSSFKNKDGELFFGGVAGFNSFYPYEIKDDIQRPTVVITDMRLLNKPVKVTPISSEKVNMELVTDLSLENKSTFSLEKVIHSIEEITLTYKDNIVSFEFAALHFSNPKKNQYAYQLVGWDKEWVTNDYKNRRATYTNLPDGDYIFKVKASNADGYWNEEGTSLHIMVLPPPWKTWWAYTLYGLFLLSLVVAFIRSQREKVLFERNLNVQLEDKVAERTAELEKVSLTDQLTGAHNRRFLDKFIDKEIAQINRAYFERKEKTLPKIGFIMLDMDHFKQVNDVYGHDAGDKVLVQLVEVITDTCRQSDRVVRWGGEEFVVVANTINLEEMQNLAERIRSNIETYSFDIGNGKSLNKTCSIGISIYPFVEKSHDTFSWEQTLNFADVALYAAKNNGRNAWISLFEKNVTDVEQLSNEMAEDIDAQIKQDHLSYETSSQNRVDWRR